MSTDLDHQVKALLDAKRGVRGEWKRAAEAAGISLSWVHQFARGCIPNPGIETLRKLHRELSQDTALRNNVLKGQP